MDEELSKPIPTKFSKEELDFLNELKERTNLSRSELIRRSVWLLYRESDGAENIHKFLGDLADERREGQKAPRKSHAPKKALPARPSRPTTPVPRLDASG